MITKRDNGSCTKSGPGRIHVEGVKSPRKPKGTAGAWAGQHTNKARYDRREAVRAMGRRQFLKALKAGRASERNQDCHKLADFGVLVFPGSVGEVA